MRIRAYIRLQRCSTGDREAFVGRRWSRHGVAISPVAYYAVEGSSWAHIRRVLKTFDVIGWSNVTPATVQGYVTDIGMSPGSLTRLTPNELPDCVVYHAVKDRKGPSPELTSFGVGAVEIADPNTTGGG